ncbi:MAG: MBL fold metallo-hydrolase, partial [Flavobacterium sp.]|nr:MBL fold metallo-hydrolase [Flavobacterium sp.]
LDNLAKRFDYIFSTEKKYPGAPTVRPVEVKNDHPFAIGSKQVIPIDTDHAGLQVFGYRIDNFAYLTDVKTIDTSELDKLRGLDVLVINVLRDEPHISHLNLEEALTLIDGIAPKKTYFTHISHNFGFHAEVESRLPENIFLAYDNLQLNL